ncbi:MAG: glycosyltransferase family 2 protein, partial [Spirochaetales bacterium]|nr:glycosyltransferase family 2 protein [Candidatus Physcosoma equi]
MSEPLISVIVPVYKVEAYLPLCVESILNQTYGNLEIILVDDGSPDQCGRMCDEYGKKDSRILVLHQENKGLSDARNAGLEKARGEYISFVDSDDWVSPYYIEHLYQSMTSGHVDLVKAWFLPFQDGEDVEEKAIEDLQDYRIYDRKSAFEHLLYMDGIDTCAWATLYKRSIIQTFRFPSGKLYEDITFTMNSIDRAS